MLNAFLPIILTSAVFSAPGSPYEEAIRISETLSIPASYTKPGECLISEGMVLSVEGYGVVKAEVEESPSACASRLEALKKVQQETIRELNARCSERNAKLKVDLEASLALNKELNKDLDEKGSQLKVQKWVNVGLVAVTVGVSTWALLK